MGSRHDFSLLFLSQVKALISKLSEEKNIAIQLNNKLMQELVSLSIGKCLVLCVDFFICRILITCTSTSRVMLPTLPSKRKT